MVTAIVPAGPAPVYTTTVMGYVEKVAQSTAEWHTDEVAFIRQYRESGADLVNMTDGGKGALSGCPRSAEHREKLRKANLGRRHSMETKEKLRRINLGKRASKETRQRMSQSQKAASSRRDCSHSPEARAKMSASQTGKKQSRETIAKRVAANTGQVRSEEAKANMRAAWERRRLKNAPPAG